MYETVFVESGLLENEPTAPVFWRESSLLFCEDVHQYKVRLYYLYGPFSSLDRVQIKIF